MDACISSDNENAITENGFIEPHNFMEFLVSLNMEVAYFSEKLTNLDLYMTIVSLGEIGLGSLSMSHNDISEEEIEKALIFDLSFGFLDSETSELGFFLEALQAKMVNASQKICTFKQSKEMYSVFQGKLRDCEVSWKHLEEQLSDLKRQLTPFHKTLSLFQEKSTYLIENEDLERSHYDLQISGQQKLVLSMLEKSLASELDLEKQLLESKRKEDDLKSKLVHTNDIISNMEAFLGLSLERLLEADHSSHIYKSIAKDMMSRLQLCQFNHHCSVRREEDLKSKLEKSLSELKERENMEFMLKELEEKLKYTESKLKDVTTSFEAVQEDLSVMEETTESLKEHVFMAENRAHELEEKLATLTEENNELREEVGFLKTRDENEDKMSLLEKQVRELEVKLQTSKFSAEASQEQQNMLYTAIWDMETLIEELKSKVTKAESRVENVDKECLVLAETNLELNKEIGFLKSENEKMVNNLKEVKKMKGVKVKEINNGAKLFTEMAVQLAIERDRVQKQLSSLERENMILLEELRKMRKNLLWANISNKEEDTKDIDCVVDNSTIRVKTTPFQSDDVVETPKSTTSSNQVDESLEENNVDEREATNSVNSDEIEVVESYRTDAQNCTNHGNVDNCENHESIGRIRTKKLKRSYIVAAIFVVLISNLAMNINWQSLYPMNYDERSTN